MKAWLLLVSGLLPGRWAAAQLPARQLPVPVQQAFARLQPRATHVRWQQLGSGYQVQFHQADKQPGQGQFAPTGAVLASRLDVGYAAFPALARTVMGEQFPHRRIGAV